MDDVPDSPDTETRRERLTIRTLGPYHPRAPQSQQQPQPQQQTEPISPQDDLEEPPTNLRGDEDDDAPQYVGRVHYFPVQLTHSSSGRNAGGSGGLLVFEAFEGLEPAFAPTPTTPPTDDSRGASRARRELDASNGRLG